MIIKNNISPYIHKRCIFFFNSLPVIRIWLYSRDVDKVTTLEKQTLPASLRGPSYVMAGQALVETSLSFSTLLHLSSSPTILGPQISCLREHSSTPFLFVHGQCSACLLLLLVCLFFDSRKRKCLFVFSFVVFFSSFLFFCLWLWLFIV